MPLGPAILSAPSEISNNMVKCVEDRRDEGTGVWNRDAKRGTEAVIIETRQGQLILLLSTVGGGKLLAPSFPLRAQSRMRNIKVENR